MAVMALGAGGALRGDADILGVGAGNEPTQFWLTCCARRVFATDLYLGGDWSESASSSMLLNPAIHWPGRWNKRRLVVQHMDGRELHFEDASLDGVFSSGSIEHFGGYEDVRRSIREMHRVLKPGGWVTLVFHNTDADVWLALQKAAAAAGFRVEGAASLDRQQRSHKGYKGRNGTEKVAHFDVVLSMQKASAESPKRRRRQVVTTDLLERTLMAAAADDPRVQSSLQWAHSVTIRSLIESHHELTDVSYDRIREVWMDVFSGARGGVKVTQRR